MIKVFLALLSALLIAGCSTVTIHPPIPLQLPASLSAGEIDQAIRAAILRSNRSSHWAGGGWAVENSQPGAITAALRVREHYLQVLISYNANSVSTAITGSRNLDQDGDSIHKKALGWQRRLEAYIQQEIGRRSSTRSLNR